MQVKRVYTSKNKDKVLQRALKDKQVRISLWKSKEGIWHAALGRENVPNHAIEVEHIR